MTDTMEYANDEVKSLIDIFDNMTPEEEAALPRPGDPPIGTFDLELAENISYASGVSRRTGDEWARRELHLIVMQQIVAEDEDETGRPGQHIFLTEFVSDDKRSLAETVALAEALGLDRVDGSYVKALRPTYCPKPESPLDGGIVEDTAGLTLRATIRQGKPRPQEGTDAMQPGRFYHRFRAIPDAD